MLPSDTVSKVGATFGANRSVAEPITHMRVNGVNNMPSGIVTHLGSGFGSISSYSSIGCLTPCAQADKPEVWLSSRVAAIVPQLVIRHSAQQHDQNHLLNHNLPKPHPMSAYQFDSQFWITMPLYLLHATFL